MVAMVAVQGTYRRQNTINAYAFAAPKPMEIHFRYSRLPDIDRMGDERSRIPYRAPVLKCGSNHTVYCVIEKVRTKDSLFFCRTFFSYLYFLASKLQIWDLDRIDRIDRVLNLPFLSSLTTL